ncbi:hypothetical protein JQC92_02340 [Shewanella sp. 202IG2-18]|uniref:hypothetical protein n=1 Tax=Parashewanella hymeniacidonis TaxID=2807618 RepID=UPI00195FE05F|nr:hypothetical protein [Parashewanella hymeniacidonis]MBM7070880.1 hypothetical protein [Parashewanella hymeniacidonis]
MDVNDFDEVLESGDEAAIEAALEEMGVEEAIVGESSEEAPVETDVTEAVADEPEQGGNAQVAEQENTETDVKPETESSTASEESKVNYIEQDGKLFVEATDVKSKNGQHSLPYDVVQSAREKEQLARQERDQLAKEKAELEQQLNELNRVKDLHTEQLKDAGLDPKKLPEQMLQDPDFVNRLKADYPDAGEAIAALNAQVEQLKESLGSQQQQAHTPEPQAPDEFNSAFNQTAHLKDWHENDVDRFEMAQTIDKKLSDDPAFADKPYSVRFAEVERRTKLAFGEALPQQQPIQTQTPAAKTESKLPTGSPLPNSPNDISGSGTVTSSHAHLLESDADTLTGQMQGMSQEAIESLLEDVSDLI